MKKATTVNENIKALFDCFDDSMIQSCFEGIYGELWCDDENEPKTAVIVSGDFHYLAGEPAYADEIIEFTREKPNAVFVPSCDSWFEELDRACGGKLKKVQRYHMHLGKAGFDELFWYPMFWLPEDLLEKHVNEDKVPYDIWLKNGYLRTCNGNKIDTDDVIDWLIEVLDTNPDLIISNGGYDSWSATEFVKKLDVNFGKVFEPVIQGKKTLSLPMQELGAEIKAKRINYGNNPIMRWCLSNTRSDTDRNGNIQPAKTLNARQRIDGTAALLNAYTVYLWHKEEYLYKINL